LGFEVLYSREKCQQQAEIAGSYNLSDGKKEANILPMFTTGLPKEENAISEGNRNILARLEPTDP